MMEILPLVEAVASIIGAIAAVAITWLVHDYTRRRDKTEVIHEMWRQQQEWNLASVASPKHAKIMELIVYGGNPSDELERLSLNSAMFFFINRINHIYDAYCFGMLNRKEFLNEAKQTAVLLVGQKKLLFSLLDNRGYDAEFASELKELIAPMEITSDVNVFKSIAS